MTRFSYRLREDRPTAIGLIALQADETIERDFRRLIPKEAELLVSRVPSSTEVTRETLREMGAHLTGAAALFPRAARFAAVGYGCTSGTAEMGSGRIASLVRDGCETKAVTEPVSALLAACAALGIRRLALLSPYVESVSDRLRAVLADAGMEVPAFGTFAEPEEARVVRIDPDSVRNAATELMQGTEADAVFLSCTNLRTLEVIAPLEADLGRPVLSSNLVLAWHLLRLVGIAGPDGAPGRIWRA